MAICRGREKAGADIIRRFTLNPLVDQVFVTYDSIQPFPMKLIDGVAGADVCNTNQYGDNGKFRLLPYALARHPSDIVMTIDDDIDYPDDYVERALEGHNRWPDRICSFHGKMLKDTPIRSYYRGGVDQVFHWQSDVLWDVHVNNIGTGVMICKSNLLKIGGQAPILQARPINMTDVHMTVYAARHKIGLTVLKHDRGWLKPHPLVDNSKSIYASSHRRDGAQTAILNRHGPFPIIQEFEGENPRLR